MGTAAGAGEDGGGSKLLGVLWSTLDPLEGNACNPSRPNLAQEVKPSKGLRVLAKCTLANRILEESILDGREDDAIVPKRKVSDTWRSIWPATCDAIVVQLVPNTRLTPLTSHLS